MPGHHLGPSGGRGQAPQGPQPGPPAHPVPSAHPLGLLQKEAGYGAVKISAGLHVSGPDLGTQFPPTMFMGQGEGAGLTLTPLTNPQLFQPH